MSETGGRAAGEGGHNQRVRWMPQQPDTGGATSPFEPDALQGASPVRRGTVGKGSGAFLIPRWRSTRVVDVVRCLPPTRLGPTPHWDESPECRPPPRLPLDSRNNPPA